MKNALRSIVDAATFLQLPREQRRVVFYSEGGSNWAHMELLLSAFLDLDESDVCYLSSEASDPGLQYKHARLRSFRTDSGWVRNWLFENIDCEVMVMTMPDLDQFQIKRSKHNVHYVYVQHSLISLHMGYRDHAYDAFDTVFCAGPHHVAEVRALEDLDGLTPKHVVQHGYERLDRIISGAGESTAKQDDGITRVLLAPTWGAQGIIETIGAQLTAILLDAGFHVTVRPHPQTARLSRGALDKIVLEHGNNSRFELDTDVAGEASLRHAELMISDWSGAAFDFSFGLQKPVLFIDGPKKVNNPRYKEVRMDAFEVAIRSEVGSVVSRDNIETVPQAILRLLERQPANDTELRDRHVFNIGNSAVVGAVALSEILDRQLTTNSI